MNGTIPSLSEFLVSACRGCFFGSVQRRVDLGQDRVKREGLLEEQCAGIENTVAGDQVVGVAGHVQHFDLVAYATDVLR